MRKIVVTLVVFCIAIFALLVTYEEWIFVLNPKGIIGMQQKDLLILSTILMLIVVIPVFIMAFVFPWKYRESNPNSKYDPNYNMSVAAEAIWWGVPTVIVIGLSIVTWIYCKILDPFIPIQSAVPVKTIQVVALPWKWLFLYPEEQLATVNYVRFPEKTPIKFEITADAPMNSFWIPQLGGQIYAMPGMRTQLQLIADTADSFFGSSANLSGLGFAGMKFTAISSAPDEYKKWVESSKRSSLKLDQNSYKELAKPSEYVAPQTYTLADQSLFNSIIMKYMSPEGK